MSNHDRALDTAQRPNPPDLELTLEVGRRVRLEDIIVVEWTEQMRRRTPLPKRQHRRNPQRGGGDISDYCGEPTDTPEWRRPLTGRLGMPPDDIWKDAQRLSHY
jgi:hypothetical protein